MGRLKPYVGTISRQSELPGAVERKEKRVEYVVTLLVHRKEGRSTSHLLQKREGKGLLAGMWLAPSSQLTSGFPSEGQASPTEAEMAAASSLADSLFPSPVSLNFSGRVQHIFTHIRQVKYFCKRFAVGF